MAKSYTQVSKGSTGGSVTELQKLLNQNGYNLSEDGVFGNKTLAAVKDYQSKNGLSVDGIVGNKTWGALTTKSTSSNSTNNTNNDKGFTYDQFEYKDYSESKTVSNAMAALNSQLREKPGELQSTWEGQVQSALDKILNREEFSYDLNSDALYQQYKDQYTQLGKLASADVMGQAAALTGGYGNSYATTAGHQAYQAYLSQLNEVVPELYGMALDRYNQEGEDLYNQYALISNEYDKEYSRHQDEYNKWFAETQLAYDRYATERSFDYSKYVNDRDYAYGVYSDDKSLAYNEYRNAIADAQWQQQYDESVRQYNESLKEQQRQFNANYSLAKQQYEASKAASSSSSGGGSGSSSGSSSSKNNQALEHVASMSSAAIVETMQGYHDDEDDKGLAAFLDDCVASGRLTESQADAYYVKYKVNDIPKQVDTTISGTVVGGISGKIINAANAARNILK